VIDCTSAFRKPRNAPGRKLAQHAAAAAQGVFERSGHHAEDRRAAFIEDHMDGVPGQGALHVRHAVRQRPRHQPEVLDKGARSACRQVALQPEHFLAGCRIHHATRGTRYTLHGCHKVFAFLQDRHLSKLYHVFFTHLRRKP
jgi:hypothetical protein